MSAILNLCLLLTQISVIWSALPPIQKCSSNNKECLKTSAQNLIADFVGGVPEVGAEVLDPCHIDIIKIDLSGLKLTFKDADVKGLRNTVVDNVSFDPIKKIMKFDFHADLAMKGQYKASGRLLILPITGDGDATIKIKHLELHMVMPYDISKNGNGKDVIDLKSYKYTYENNVNTHFKLTNLFNGNKELSDAMHTFMNENWKAISQEFATPVIDKPMEKIFNSMKAFFKAMSLEDIFDTYVTKD